MGRLRHLAAFTRSELAALWRERAAGGMEHALSARLGHHAGNDPVRTRLDGLADTTDELAGRVGSTDGRLVALERREAEGHGALEQVAVRIEELRCRIDEVAAALPAVHQLEARLGQVSLIATELERRSAEQEGRLARLERAQSVGAVMAWVEHAHLSTAPLVSVILPTRNRRAHLPRALSSVADQTYPHWELVVVDDGSDDDTAAVVASFPDPRIRYLRIAHRGVCAARNCGLAEARGEIVAYLDDDNTMHPGWLKTVVWGFEQHPDADAAYGAFVIDDPTRVNGPGSGTPPTLYLHPYDRDTLRRANLADISAIAHRAGLAEANFDEGLREMGDWDLLLRITAHRDPLVLPAIACFYATDAPNRLTGGPTFHRDLAEVWRKNGIEDQVPAP
jgi:hypothetical protein